MTPDFIHEILELCFEKQRDIQRDDATVLRHETSQGFYDAGMDPTFQLSPSVTSVCRRRFHR
jgi:hypothetical protein